jgi:tRNA A37 methylthiotransferase MiaB
MRKGKIIFIECDVQSGNERILKLMNRYHNIGEFLKLFSEFKKANPEVYVLSHFIIGFPSETDAEFQDTLNVMKHLMKHQKLLDEVQVNPYGDMEGAISYKMPDKVPQKVIEERLKIARNVFEKEDYVANLDIHGLSLKK